MFEKTLELLGQINGHEKYTMYILPDDDGYYDKECPNTDCLAKFKVNAEDWENLFSGKVVYCPFCRYEAPSGFWWTTEQQNQLERQALQYIEAKIGEALKSDAENFNRNAPNGAIKMSMKFSGSIYASNLPAVALEEMEQKITCDECGAKYAVVGSAFYCPCCGTNSAKQTFLNTIKKVKAKVKYLETIRDAISQYSKDEAVRTCMSLVETSIPDLVVALQRLCECVYPQIEGAKPLKKNVFQRLDEGSMLWKELVGTGYEDWIDPLDYELLKKCFQQRHNLQHNDGIVDQDYLTKSGDTAYKIGQHLVIKKEIVDTYARIVIYIGNHILGLIGVC